MVESKVNEKNDENSLTYRFVELIYNFFARVVSKLSIKKKWSIVSAFNLVGIRKFELLSFSVQVCGQHYEKSNIQD